MILIGQFDSPFVRRVAIALDLYGIDFEHRPWSTFGDAELLAPLNPLRRVPTLVTDDGDVLIESFVILDWLDEIAGPERALVAPRGAARGTETLRSRHGYGGQGRQPDVRAPAAQGDVGGVDRPLSDSNR